MLQYNGTVYSVIMILLLLFLPAGILGLRPKMASGCGRRSRARTLEEDRAVARGCRRRGDAAPPSTMAAARSGAGWPRAPRRSRSAACLREDLARQKSETRAAAPLLRVEDVSVHFGGLKAVSEVSFEVQGGQHHRPHRSQRRRQDHAVQRHQPAAGDDRRAHLVRGHRTDQARARPTRPAWAWPAPSRTCASS